jgi:hypothetical protein
MLLYRGYIKALLFIHSFIQAQNLVGLFNVHQQYGVHWQLFNRFKSYRDLKTFMMAAEYSRYLGF